MENKKILAGLHNPTVANVVKVFAGKYGYSFQNIDSSLAYLEEAGRGIYDTYFFDVNLGSGIGEDVSFTERLMALPKIQEARATGARFIGTSGGSALNAARELGIEDLILLSKPITGEMFEKTLS